jgi:hypothetical protein
LRVIFGCFLRKKGLIGLFCCNRNLNEKPTFIPLLVGQKKILPLTFLAAFFIKKRGTVKKPKNTLYIQ